MDQSCIDVTTVLDMYSYCVHEMLRFANTFKAWKMSGVFSPKLSDAKIIASISVTVPAFVFEKLTTETSRLHEKSESRLMYFNTIINYLRPHQVCRFNINTICSLNKHTLNSKLNLHANCQDFHAISQQLFLSLLDFIMSQVKEHAKFLHGEWMIHLPFTLCAILISLKT